MFLTGLEQTSQEPFPISLFPHMPVRPLVDGKLGGSADCGESCTSLNLFTVTRVHRYKYRINCLPVAIGESKSRAILIFNYQKIEQNTK